MSEREVKVRWWVKWRRDGDSGGWVEGPFDTEHEAMEWVIGHDGGPDIDYRIVPEQWEE